MEAPRQSLKLAPLALLKSKRPCATKLRKIILKLKLPAAPMSRELPRRPVMTAAAPTRAKSIAEKLGFINFDEEELDMPSFMRKDEKSEKDD